MRGRVDQHRRLREVERDLAAAGRRDVELLVQARDRVDVQPLARVLLERNVDEAAAVELATRDVAAFLRPAQRRGRARGRNLGHLERDLLALRVFEAHLELAVKRQHPHLVGDVRQEQHRGRALADVRQVGVQASADAEVVVGEVEGADDQELAVGADEQRDPAVEHLLGGVLGVDDGRADDRHRRGEGGRPTVLRRFGDDRQVLLDDLRLDGRQPLVGRQVGRRLEGGAAQRHRVGDRRQGVEELHAGDEVVQGQAEWRIEDDPCRQLDGDHQRQRPEIGQGEADTEPGHAEHREGALDACVEDALLHRRGDVGVVDDVVVVVDLDDSADQRGVELAAEELALDLDPKRRDADDGEFAAQELVDVDLDPFDRPRERQPCDALDPGDARGQGQDEVARVGGRVAIRPLDADLVDVNRQPGRPREAVAVRAADREEDAEARQGLERAVAQELEVARLAADVQAGDRELGLDRGEADQRVGRPGAGVDLEVLGAQDQEGAELDVELVRAEQEGREAVAGEHEGGAEADLVRVRPVGDLALDRAVGQEVGALGGQDQAGLAVRSAAELGVPVVERDLEVGNAQAEVVEVEDAGDADIAGEGDGAHAELEPVVVDRQARDRRAAAQRRRARYERALDPVQRGQLDARAVDDEDRLVRARVVLGEVRVVGDLDPGRLDADRVRDVHGEGRDVEGELAADAERLQKLAGIVQGLERLEDVDLDLEGAQDAGQVGADQAVGAAEVQPGLVGAEADRQGQDPVLEVGVGEADRRVLEDDRRAGAAGLRVGARGAHVARAGGDREACEAVDAVERRDGRAAIRVGDVLRLPAARTEVDVDLTGLEHLARVDGGLRLEEESVAGRAELGDHVRVLGQAVGARAAQSDERVGAAQRARA